MQGIEDVYEQAAQDLYATRLEAFFIITNFVKGAGVETLPTAIYGAVRQGIKPNIMAISTLLLMVSVVFVTLSYFVGRMGDKKG